jgi:hypothetical protein
MNNFGLVVIGAHNGSGLENDVLNTSKKILFIEPVKYNFLELQDRYKNQKNIYFDNSAISNNNDRLNFFSVKKNSVEKLGKHWATGIGSFSKKHILDHKSKRFQISVDDIDTNEILPEKRCETFDPGTVATVQSSEVVSRSYASSKVVADFCNPFIKILKAWVLPPAAYVALKKTQLLMPAHSFVWTEVPKHSTPIYPPASNHKADLLPLYSLIPIPKSSLPPSSVFALKIAHMLLAFDPVGNLAEKGMEA